MKTMISAVAALFLLTSLVALAQTATEPINPSEITNASHWTLINVDAESVTVDGKSAIHLVSHGDSANGIIGLALPQGQTFRTGIIEIDLKGKRLKGNSFLGVAFNVTDAKKFEAIYFRPFNFNVDLPFRDRAVQYISWPGNTWESLRKGQPGRFENRVSNVADADEWFHARIEVTETHVRVFVNSAAEPSLVVERLAQSEASRPPGLFVDISDGYYANLKITPET